MLIQRKAFGLGTSKLRDFELKHYFGLRFTRFEGVLALSESSQCDMFVTYHNFDVSMTPLILGAPLIGGNCHFSSAEAMGSIGSQAAQSVTATMSTANGQGTYMNVDTCTTHSLRAP